MFISSLSYSHTIHTTPIFKRCKIETIHKKTIELFNDAPMPYLSENEFFITANKTIDTSFSFTCLEDIKEDCLQFSNRKKYKTGDEIFLFDKQEDCYVTTATMNDFQNDTFYGLIYLSYDLDRDLEIVNLIKSSIHLDTNVSNLKTKVTVKALLDSLKL